jgi:fermentation-respiration switch protein FrsA (DUF1100 family)
MIKNLVQLIGGLFFVYCALILMLFMQQRSMMYFPQSALPPALAAQMIPDGRAVNYQTADGLTLTSYLISPQDKKPIIIAFHGNGSLAPYMAEQFQAVVQEGYGLLLAEYRGYADNPGKPTEEGLYLDAEAAINFIQANHSKSSIILYGQSLGSGVVVEMAYRTPEKFKAIILEVPFDSALNVAKRIYPFIPLLSLIMKDKYLSDTKIHRATMPKLFLLAERDEVVGLDSGLRLYNLASKPKVKVILPAGHNDVFSPNGLAQREMLNFLKGLEKVAP